MSAQDDSQAVRQLLRIFKPLERLQGVLDRAATLEAAGPALEAKKAALEQDVGALTEKVIALRQEAEDLDRSLPDARRRRQAEQHDALRDLDRQHQEEIVAKRREHSAALTELAETRLGAERELTATLTALREARESLKALSDRITVGAGS